MKFTLMILLAIMLLPLMLTAQELVDTITVPIYGCTVDNIYQNNDGWIITGWQFGIGLVVFVDHDGQRIQWISYGIQCDNHILGVQDCDNNWYFAFPYGQNAYSYITKCTNTGNEIWTRSISGNVTGGFSSGDYIYLCGYSYSQQCALYILKHDSNVITEQITESPIVGQYTCMTGVGDNEFCAGGMANGQYFIDRFLCTPDSTVMVQRTSCPEFPHGSIVSMAVHNITNVVVCVNTGSGSMMWIADVLHGWSVWNDVVSDSVNAQSIRKLNDSLFVVVMKNGVVDTYDSIDLSTPYLSMNISSNWPVVSLGIGEHIMVTAANDNMWYGANSGYGIHVLHYRVNNVSCDNQVIPKHHNQLVVYPQPAKTSSYIKFSNFTLPVSEFSVYDVRGRLIYSHTINGPEITWDTKDKNGVYVQSGMYLCRIGNDVAKMLIVK